MADTATQDKVPSEAEQRAANKAKLAKIEKAEQAEKDAAEAFGGPQAAKPAEERPVAPQTEGFRQAQPRDRGFAYEVRNCHDIICRGVTPEHALDPRYLWQMQHKLNRYDELIMHDEAFRWEFRARVMYKNAELQLVQIDPITPIVRHEVGSSVKVNFSEVKIEHKGSVDKWTVFLGNVKLKTGFETPEEAEDWVRVRKAAA
jgi:hypothetical protein